MISFFTTYVSWKYHIFRCTYKINLPKYTDRAIGNDDRMKIWHWDTLTMLVAFWSLWKIHSGRPVFGILCDLPTFSLFFHSKTLRIQFRLILIANFLRLAKFLINTRKTGIAARQRDTWHNFLSRLNNGKNCTTEIIFLRGETWLNEKNFKSMGENMSICLMNETMWWSELGICS